MAPSYVDPTWTEPTSSYQVQMYKISDPNLYFGSTLKGGSELQAVYHLKEDFTLLAFHESDITKILAPKELEKFVTRHKEAKLKLTSTLLLLRPPEPQSYKESQELLQKHLDEWEKQNPDWKEKGVLKPAFEILELYKPTGKEAFANAPVDSALENWVDKDFIVLDSEVKQPYHSNEGVIFINNPREYRIAKSSQDEGWHYDPSGSPIESLEELRSHSLGFRSRADLIHLGERLYAEEGCYYCHTDQTRTLVQDVVLNGSAEFPAPPSSANEYIFQEITFPGTRRIGPDISRTGIKKPSRDWHKGHFWSPKTASQGSIMPSFKHFFDADPRGTGRSPVGIPNYRFEAIYQYLMTKGTRITPPTQAWWLGKDPVDTKAIIEGKKRLK